MGIMVIVFLMFVIYMSIRSLMVTHLQRQLLDEEYKWLAEHDNILFPKGTIIGFRRYQSLPSHKKMLLCFWVPLRSYDDALKPIATYYEDCVN